MFTMPIGLMNAGAAVPTPPAKLSGWSTTKIMVLVLDTDIASGLINFPVLGNICATSGATNFDATAVFDELGSSSLKIAVQSWDTGNECYVEIERWDDTNEDAQIWFKAPHVNLINKRYFYLYYDSAHADNTTYVGGIGSTAGQSVWDSNFVAVYHLSQDPSGGAGCILDSTSNGHHGTPSAGMSASDLIDGPVGKAITFANGDDKITTAASQDFSALETAYTLEACVDWNTPGSYDQVAQVGADANGALTFKQHSTTSHLACGVWGDQAESTVDLSSGSWNTYGIQMTSSINTVYKDGVSAATSNPVTVQDLSSDNIVIGGANSSTYEYGVQKVRELRISSVKRSVDWATATAYANVDNFVTFSALP